MNTTRPTGITIILALLALSGTSAGCSFVERYDRFHASDDAAVDRDASPDSAVPLTIDTFLPLFFDGLCSKSVRCETKSGIGGLLELFCHPQIRTLYLDKVFGTFAGFDAALAQQCLDGLASIDCSISNTLFDASCEQFFVGAAATGEPCLTDFTCAAGRCEEPPNACGNVCVDRGNVGAACLDTNGDNDCDSPLRCRQGICQAAGEIGQGCEKAEDCIPLTWCAPGGTCQAAPNSGDVCLIDGTTGYSDPCRGSLVCTTDMGLSTRSCQAGKTAGQACSSNEPCAPGLRCKTGVCHVISPPGGSCVSRDDCPSIHECIAEICTPYAGLGQACSPTLPCFQGACMGGVCSGLADGAMCDGSNGLLGGQCLGYCKTSTGTPYLCAPRGAIGAACDGVYDDEACADGLGCVDVGGGGTFTCQQCN